MKNECEHLAPRLSAYLDGELPDKERQEVEKHLKSCQVCQEFASDLEQTARILKSTSAPGTEAAVDLTGVWEEIESQVDFGPTIWQRIKKWIGKPAVWLPAAVAAASVALVIYMRPMPQEHVTLELSRVESVYSKTGSVMVLQTATSGRPLILILPETVKRG